MALDVAKALVGLSHAKVGFFGVLVLAEPYLVGCLCWLALVGISKLLPSKKNIGEADLRDDVFSVAGDVTRLHAIPFRNL